MKESKVPGICNGDQCIPIAQFDKFNCVGFFIIQTNISGIITSFDFYTTPDVTFSSEYDKRLRFTHVPKDAVDAIGYRAIAFGIVNDKVIPSKHIQRYDQFRDYVDKIYKNINKNLFENFNEGITNAAGYLYIIAMSEAVKRSKGIELIRFNEPDALTGKIPDVEPKYQEWTIQVCSC